MAITHPPRGHPFGQGPLAAPQDLRGHAQQPQALTGALDGPNGQAGTQGELGVAGAAVSAGVEVGEPGQGRRDEHQGVFVDAPVAHLGPNCLVAQLVGDRHGDVCPSGRAAAPARDAGVGVGLEFEVDEAARRRQGAFEGAPGPPYPHDVGGAGGPNNAAAAVDRRTATVGGWSGRDRAGVLDLLRHGGIDVKKVDTPC